MEKRTGNSSSLFGGFSCLASALAFLKGNTIETFVCKVTIARNKFRETCTNALTIGTVLQDFLHDCSSTLLLRLCGVIISSARNHCTDLKVLGCLEVLLHPLEGPGWIKQTVQQRIQVKTTENTTRLVFLETNFLIWISCI